MSDTTSSRAFDVVVLRQDGPGRPSYWQRFAVPYEADMNVISALQKIAAMGRTADGKAVSPVVWDCNCLEEVCGACTMVINGKVRQACTALVDRLLEDNPEAIELRPMTKFPVVRDLMVDRSRMFATLKKIKAWLPVDSYYDIGEAARQSQENQQIAYELSKCMTCGCCLEACPQYLKIELVRHEGESDEAFHARETEAFFRSFMGASAIAQVDLFNTNPTGAMTSRDRLDALVSEGGIQVCGNAQNCVQVCPKDIPLTTSIARMGRAATVHTLKQWFDR
ncbi:MAG: succinate dehydrogenase iron-sulfur subunit [Planctomycetaceae bacterium]|jgi:succinate dehydrogenase / fumarate reductase iron-sulfur subunit|nr:succinate dehydrogenase iron-sulfur subunit [Planctomycetaceae bacterium]